MSTMRTAEHRERIGTSVKRSIAERRRAGTYTPPRPRVDSMTVKRIVQLRGRGFSLRRIACALTIECRPTPRGRTRQCAWFSFARNDLLRLRLGAARAQTSLIGSGELGKSLLDVPQQCDSVTWS